MAAGSYDGSIRINTTLNTTPFNNGLQAMKKGLSGITKALGAALSIAALVKFGKECVELASDLAEVDNVVSKSFGNLRGQMDALANESIKTLGMSRLTAYQTGSTFMSMGKAMMDDQQAAADMAIELTKLTGNMSSFYNKSQDLVSIALKSVYTGETETLKQYGIVMTEVNLKQFALEQGITKSYSAMTQAEKVMLRYQYVMKQTEFIGEDFVDTQNSWANQTRILTEQWKEFMTIIGNGLVTVLTPVIQVLNKIVASLITLANTVSKVMSTIFGIKMQTLSAGADSAADSYEDAADAATDLADATTEAGEAADGATASFDDLNVLQMDSGSSSGSSAGGSGLNLDTEITETEEDISEEPDYTWIDKLKKKIDELIQKLKELRDIFLKAFTLSALNLNLADRFKGLIDTIKNIGKSLKEIFTDSDVLNAVNNFVTAVTKAFGQFTAAIISIGTTIAENLLGGISKYLEQNKERIKEYLITMFNVGSEIATQLGNFSEAFANVFSAFGGENGQQVTANIIGIFSDAYMGVTELCSKLGRDALTLITQPFIDNQEELKTTLDGILEIFANLTGGIKKVIDDVVDKLNEVYDTRISPFIKSITAGISTLFNTILNLWNTHMQPFINNLVTSLNTLWNEHLSILFSSLMNVIGRLFTVIQTLWQTVLVPVLNWILQNVVPVILDTVLPMLEGLWDCITEGIGFVSDVLTIFFDMVTQYIDGLIEYFNGLIEFITGVFTGDWKLAWQGITDIMQGVSDMFKAIINGIIALIESMVNSLIDGINMAIDKIQPLVSAANSVLGALSAGTVSFELDHVGHVTLPRLANGGITTGSTLAQIGEAGKEAILPLEQNTEWMDTLASKLARKMGSSGSDQPVYLQVDGKTFARLMNPYTDAENKRIGVSFA